MQEQGTIVVIHRQGSVERHYLTDLRVPSDLLTGSFWFVTDEVVPKILRLVGYTDNHAKNQGVKSHPLTRRAFKHRKKMGYFLQVEEVCVPTARSMSANKISAHFNWPLIRRW